MQTIRALVFSLLLFPATGFSAALPADTNTIVVAADLWCPYTCAADSQQPGYMIEILQAVLADQGLSVRYVNMPWRRALESTQAGHIDAVAGANSGNRLGNIIGGQSLGVDESVLITRINTRIPYQGPASLDNYRLGYIKGYLYDNGGPIDQYIANRRQNITTLHHENSLKGLLRMLVTQRIDAFYENRLVALYTASQLNLTQHIKIAGSAPPTPVYIAFSPTARGQELALMLDQGLLELRHSGKLQTILDKYQVPDWAAAQ